MVLQNYPQHTFLRYVFKQLMNVNELQFHVPSKAHFHLRYLALVWADYIRRVLSGTEDCLSWQVDVIQVWFPKT